MQKERCTLLTFWWDKLSPLRKRFINETYIGGFEKEDIEQECFLLLHKALEQYDPQLGVPFESYYRVVLYGWRSNERRRRGNTEIACEEEVFGFLVDERVNVERDVERKLVEEDVRRFIKGLDEKEKEVIMAYYFQHKTMKEIAEAKNVSYRTIEGRKKRALYKLGELLS